MKIYIDKFKSLYDKYPLVLIDVGASGGLEKHWRHARDHLRVIAFEPDERANDTATGNGHTRRSFNKGLYSRRCSLDLYKTKKQQASSVFKPNFDFISQFPEASRFAVEASDTIDVDTLDNVLGQENITDVDFIKVDTQGSELNILEGAGNILRKGVFGLEAEVEFCAIYEGQPLFSDLDSYVRPFHFQLFDLQQYYWKREKGKALAGRKGQLIFANALYLKEPSQFIKEFEGQDNEFIKSKVLRAVSICLLYGYFDYAKQLLGAVEHIFDKNECRYIDDRLKQGVIYDNVLEPVRNRLKDLKYFVKRRIFRENSWSYADRYIGNHNGS